MHIRTKIIALILLALSALCTINTAFAQQTQTYTDQELLEQYTAFHDELVKYKTLWDDVTAKTANNQYIDWDEIARQLGIQPSTPDDIRTRLSELNYYSDLWNEFDQARAAEGQTVEDYMRWLLGESTNSRGETCAQDSACYAQTRAKIDSILRQASALPPGEGPSQKRALHDLSYLVSKIHNQIPGVIHLFYALSYTIGVLLIIISLMRLKEYGETASSRYGRPGLMTSSLAAGVAGVALIYLPTALEAGIGTLLAQGGDNSLFSYHALKNQGFGYEELISPVVDIVKLVGLLAFIRGWMMLSKMGNEEYKGSMFKGVVHVIGGILAVNILSIYNLISLIFRRLF